MLVMYLFASYWGLGDQLMATDLVLEVGERVKDINS